MTIKELTNEIASEIAAGSQPDKDTELRAIEIINKVVRWLMDGTPSGKAGLDYQDLATRLRIYGDILVERLPPSSNLPGQVLLSMLQMALWDAIRAQWYATVKRAGLESNLAVARQLMKEDRYEGDPICMVPGQKFFVCHVDGKEVVNLDFSVANATPLSAIYADKVQAAIDLADKVVKAAAQFQPKSPEDASSPK